MKNVTIVPICPETRLTDICKKYKIVSGNFYSYLKSFFSIVKQAKMGDDQKFGMHKNYIVFAILLSEALTLKEGSSY